MELKPIAVGAVAMLLVISVVGAGAFVATGGLDSNQTSPTPEQTETPTSTETQETVNEDDVNEEAQTSLEGAHALKSALGDSEYSDARVFVKKDGTLLVAYNASAEMSGTQVKSDMTDIAYLYSDVMAEHNETGSLTIHANGATLMVSPDAAASHGNGNLKDDAYEQTFHWTSQKEGDN